MPVVQYLQVNFPVFVLTFIRLSALFWTMPLFGYSTIYPRLRVMLAFGFSLMLLPLLHLQVAAPQATGTLVLWAMREAGLGLVLGFGANLIFEAFNFSGTLLAQQTGFAMANVFDPTNEQQTTVINQFWFLMMMVYMFASNGHLLLIEVVTRNFQLLPLAGTTLKPAIAEQLSHGTTLFFEVGFKIAAPVFMLLLVLEAALALVARVMPQMNVFFVALPLKLAVGLWAIISSLTIFQSVFAYFLDDLMQFLEGLIRALR